MGRGLSELQKTALTTAVTLNPDHQRSSNRRPTVTKELAAVRAELLDRMVEPDPPHTQYNLQPWELIDQYYCQQVQASNAQQVAVSKALARLVDRGLMVKLDNPGFVYPAQYHLTDAGLAKAAELLTAK